MLKLAAELLDDIGAPKFRTHEQWDKELRTSPQNGWVGDRQQAGMPGRTFPGQAMTAMSGVGNVIKGVGGLAGATGSNFLGGLSRIGKSLGLGEPLGAPEYYDRHSRAFGNAALHTLRRPWTTGPTALDTTANEFLYRTPEQRANQSHTQAITQDMAQYAYGGGSAAADWVPYAAGLKAAPPILQVPPSTIATGVGLDGALRASTIEQSKDPQMGVFTQDPDDPTKIRSINQDNTLGQELPGAKITVGEGEQPQGATGAVGAAGQAAPNLIDFTKVTPDELQNHISQLSTLPHEEQQQIITSNALHAARNQFLAANPQATEQDLAAHAQTVLDKIQAGGFTADDLQQIKELTAQQLNLSPKETQPGGMLDQMFAGFNPWQLGALAVGIPLMLVGVANMFGGDTSLMGIMSAIAGLGATAYGAGLFNSDLWSTVMGGAPSPAPSAGAPGAAAAVGTVGAAPVPAIAPQTATAQAPADTSTYGRQALMKAVNGQQLTPQQQEQLVQLVLQSNPAQQPNSMAGSAFNGISSLLGQKKVDEIKQQGFANPMSRRVFFGMPQVMQQAVVDQMVAEKVKEWRIPPQQARQLIQAVLANQV